MKSSLFKVSFTVFVNLFSTQDWLWCLTPRVSTFGIDVIGVSVGKEPWPGCGQTVVGESKLPDTLQILFPEPIAVTGYISSVVFKHPPFGMAERVPYAGASTIHVPATCTTVSKYIIHNHISFFIMYSCQITTLKMWLLQNNSSLKNLLSGAVTQWYYIAWYWKVL